MLYVQCLESKNTKPTELFAKFQIEPFIKGQSITVGNALRRTLLSNIPGIAVIGVRIAGINHEFSSIPGVKEDVLEILLNLKQLVFKGTCTEAIIVRLNFQGPGIINANDMELSPFLEFVDPNAYIATVENSVALEMELFVTKGRGYSLNNNFSTVIPKGFLSIDAVFMPVRKVNFFIEISQDNSLNEQENLVLEIQTNGSITPSDALNIGAKELARIFTAIRSNDVNDLEPVFVEEETGYIETQSDVKNTLIEELELSVRAYNCLKRANIHTLADLLNYSQEELLEFKNFGQKSADEVCENLYRKFNLTLNQ
jgi:DNA-directed RNA polymerase subunit alpha